MHIRDDSIGVVVEWDNQRYSQLYEGGADVAEFLENIKAEEGCTAMRVNFSCYLLVLRFQQ